MDRPDINWVELAEAGGIATKYTATGGSSTNRGSEEARLLLSGWSVTTTFGRGVPLWLEGRPGQQAAAAAVWSVLMYIRSHEATNVAFEACQAARKEGNSDTRGASYKRYLPPAALNWVEEFLACTVPDHQPCNRPRLIDRPARGA